MATFANAEPLAKRRKIGQDAGQEMQAVESSIRSARDLRTALRSDEDADYRAGIQAFKLFLQSLGPEEGSRAPKLQILKSYCEDQSARKSGYTISFHDLLTIWSSAVEAKNESLLSAVPSVLALFLKTISTELDFREYGIALCKDLLQKEQLRLLDRGLTATKTKEHLISPCIRLLAEVVSFDGGAVAGAVYSQRETTLKRLDQFLSQRSSRDENERRSKKPSLRRIAQRYVIAYLKHQDANAKTDLITQGTLLKAFLQGIKDDNSDIVLDILEVIERNIVKDSNLTRNTKHRFLTYSNLTSMSTLYSFNDDESEESTAKIQQRAHAFLLLVCTSYENGILRRETGWYPHGSSPESQTIDGTQDEYIDLGVDSLFSANKQNEKISVKNSQLSGFIQTLRLENTRQAELLLEIFKAAPELVADYFSKKTSFQVEPKPVPQWLGFSAVIFSTIQLPVPENCGWSGELPLVPPPTTVAIENVLPRPMDRATLTRCLNMNHEIITLFAIRALSAAFKKLGNVLAQYQRAPEGGLALWRQSSSKLKETFSQRVPVMKDIIATYHRVSKTDPSMHEAVVELLAFYYQFLPDVAMTEKFDASVALVDVFGRLEKDLSEDDRDTSMSLLTHLLKIAQTSSDTRWWNKPESLAFSPFTSLLRVIAATHDRVEMSGQMRDLLTDICIENGIVRNKRSLNALLAALRTSNGQPVKDVIFQAIDQCVGRLVRRPVQYLDFVADLAPGHQNNNLSLLPATMTEQYRFIAELVGQQELLQWFRQLFHNLEVVGEDTKLLDGLRKHIIEASKDIKDKLKPSAKEILHAPAEPWTEKKIVSTTEDVEMEDVSEDTVTEAETFEIILEAAFPSIDSETISESSIERWSKQEVETALTSGTITALIQNLQSSSPEIRLQSLIALQRFNHKLTTSSYQGWQSFYLFIGSIVETTKSVAGNRLASPGPSPLPTILVVLAKYILPVLLNPLHKAFPKVNLFLNKSPIWPLHKLPSYWVEQILLQQPDHDDGYFEETHWLFDVLIHSLRTSSDLEIYRRSKILERVLAWATTPGIATSRLYDRVLELVYRAARVDEGMTLITRTGILSWLDVQAQTQARARARQAEVRNLDKSKQSIATATQPANPNTALALKQLLLHKAAVRGQGNNKATAGTGGGVGNDLQDWTGLPSTVSVSV